MSDYQDKGSIPDGKDPLTASMPSMEARRIVLTPVIEGDLNTEELGHLGHGR
jgi:hypothetical protein